MSDVQFRNSFFCYVFDFGHEGIAFSKCKNVQQCRALEHVFITDE